MKRRLKITVTKIQRQRTTIKPPFFHAHCPICAREVELLTYAESVEILGVENQTLEALIAAGVVHATETISGGVWICKESLFR